MKLLIFCLFLIGYCDRVRSRSTVIDTLKVGSDAIFRYEYKAAETSTGKPKDFETFTGNIHLRKASKKHQFIMFMKDVHFESSDPEEIPTESDLKALELPILVSVNNEFDLDYVKTLKNETKKSITDKHDILELMIIDLTDIIVELPTILSEKNIVRTREKIDEMPFGNCNMQLKYARKNNMFVMEMKAKRSQCTGELDKEILSVTNTTDISRNSEFKTSYIFDEATLEFRGGEMEMQLKVQSNDTNINFKIEFDFDFVEYKPIEYEISETVFEEKITAQDMPNVDEDKRFA